jgi:hypothetical protein
MFATKPKNSAQHNLEFNSTQDLQHQVCLFIHLWASTGRKKGINLTAENSQMNLPGNKMCQRILVFYLKMTGSLNNMDAAYSGILWHSTDCWG